MRNREARPLEVPKVAGNLRPGFSAIKGLLNIPIISTGPDLAFLHRRFGKTDNRAVILRAGVFEGNRATGVFLLFGIIGREIGTYLLPRLTKISGLKYDIPAKEERVLVVGREDDGGIPVEAILLTHSWSIAAPAAPRVYCLLLARAKVSANNVSTL